MKQNIRYSTFETNSSSYHSISIHKHNENLPKTRELEIGKKTILDGKINYKTIGYTSSYSYTSQTKYDKANMILRFASAFEEDWIYDQPEYDEISEIRDDEERFKRLAELSNRCPVFTAMKKVISEYTGAEVEIPLNDYHGTDFEYMIYDEAHPAEELLGLSEEDMNNEEKLIDAYKKIIFDDNIEITEECESNE